MSTSAEFKRSPASVAASGTTYQDWVDSAEIISLGKDDPTFLAIQREVEEMCKLVVPEEWRDPNYRTHLNRRGAADFRKDVVSAADEDAFRGPDDRDSRAVLESFLLLLALSENTRKKKRKNEATYRRAMDNLLSHVFEMLFLLDDDKDEFGKFAVKFKEGIWLKDNPVSTNEARPDVLVVTAPTGIWKLQYELLCLADQERSGMPPPAMPSATAANPTATSPIVPQNTSLPALLVNLQHQYNIDSPTSISLILLPMEHKTHAKLHAQRQLLMDFTTAHLQRRALLLEERPLFGLTLDDEGISVHVSMWAQIDSRYISVSEDPIHVFDLNNPPQVLQLFLFLRRLAKKVSADFAIDEEAINSNASAIASNLLKGTTVWRTFPTSLCTPSTHDARPAKRRKVADASDGLTTDNLSVLHQGEGCDIERWVADVQPDGECAMSGDILDQQEPCVEDEVVVEEATV